MFEKYRRVITIILIAFLLIILLKLLIVAVSASETFYFSKLNPTNSNPLEYRVKQGDTIYQGKTYDLSSLGISYEYAWWSDWKLANTNCNPDKIIDIRYWRTLSNRNAVYIDPQIWNAGDWYYWDGYECNITYYDYSLQKIVKVSSPRGADNKFAFTVSYYRQQPILGIILPSDTQAIPLYQSAYL